MKHFYSLILLFVFSAAGLWGQVQIDTIASLGPYLQINLAPGSEGKPLNIYTSHFDDQSGLPILLHFDQNLNILDTLTGQDAGRPGGRFTNPFTFNNSLYYFGSDSIGATGRNFSFHKLKNGVFTDSIELNLDTIPDAYPEFANVLDHNTLEVYIGIYPAAGGFKGNHILHLDSNFNFKNYYRPKLDSVPPTWGSKRIYSIHHLNDSIWHIFPSSKSVVVYNINRDTIESIINVIHKTSNTYKLNGPNYLALGLTTLPNGSNTTTSLGFYVMDNNANVLDTVSFNAYQDTVAQWNYVNYSSEKSASTIRNNIIYDTSNIYLAGDGDYTKFNTSNRRRYFYVVKTDIKGTLIWQFIMGGIDNSTILTGIYPTDDKGCIVTGLIERLNSESAILIKFGPDGNISNVELDAPENLVEFYPNPVKDKLSYQ